MINIKNIDAYGMIYKLNIIFYLDYGNSYKNTFGQGPKGNTKMCKHILLNDKIVGKFLF